MQLVTKLTFSAAFTALIVRVAALPQAGYDLTFVGQTSAAEGDDYLTFNLVPTAGDCLGFCDSVPTCKFANLYHDNDGKNGSPLFTCAIFSGCHGVEDLTNPGGQIQPDGKVNFITESSGFCQVTQ